MKALKHVPLPRHLTAIFMLARRLEQRESRMGRVDAELYRFEARCLTEELRGVAEGDAGLQALLGVFPALAQLYENLHYARTGLSQSHTPAALAAKVQARKAIMGAQRSARAHRP